MYEGSKIKYLTGGKNYLTKKDVPQEIKPFISFGEWHLFELEKSQPVEVWTPIGKNRLVKKNKMFELKAEYRKNKGAFFLNEKVFNGSSQFQMTGNNKKW